MGLHLLLPAAARESHTVQDAVFPQRALPVARAEPNGAPECGSGPLEPDLLVRKARTRARRPDSLLSVLRCERDRASHGFGVAGSAGDESATEPERVDVPAAHSNSRVFGRLSRP